MNHPGWLLVIVGLAVAVLGALWLFLPNIPWLGRLPGDIAIDRGNTKIYIPIVTCLVLSAVLSLVMWLVRYFSA